jgi:hypothetical protein
MQQAATFYPEIISKLFIECKATAGARGAE